MLCFKCEALPFRSKTGAALPARYSGCPSVDRLIVSFCSHQYQLQLHLFGIYFGLICSVLMIRPTAEHWVSIKTPHSLDSRLLLNHQLLHVFTVFHGHSHRWCRFLLKVLTPNRSRVWARDLASQDQWRRSQLVFWCLVYWRQSCKSCWRTHTFFSAWHFELSDLAMRCDQSFSGHKGGWIWGNLFQSVGKVGKVEQRWKPVISNQSRGGICSNELQVPGQLCPSHSARCRCFTGVSAHLRWLVMNTVGSSGI